MARKLPPLSYLPYLRGDRARLGLVTRAADELGRTHGAISKQLQLAWSRSAFLCSTRRHQHPPQPARRGAVAIVGEALDELESGYDALLSADSDPEIHVACSATFAMRWLVPRARRFLPPAPERRVQPR